MEAQKISWKKQTFSFNENINYALQQQHHAAQFIALVGHHLIPQKADDSNTNMEFVPEKNILLGNQLPNGLRVALHLSDLKILILDEKKEIRKEISLDGKTKEEGFAELKESLGKLGVDVGNFNIELHYEMPAHELDKGAVFSIKNENDFIENATYRHNAKIVIGEIARNLEQAEPVRVWPHHFDTGSFLPVSKNEKGELSQSIGMGWAMPDSMVDEPYYYLSFWSEKAVEGSEGLSPLENGRWMMPNWNGAVLRHSEILDQKSALEQFEMVSSFFNNGIQIVTNLLKK